MKGGQAAKILRALASGKMLTPVDALEEFGCFRLGARVYDLRGAGWNVQAQSVSLQSGKKVARYWLPMRDCKRYWTEQEVAR